MFSSTQIQVHGLDDHGFETIYLARQPIVDRDENLHAYELLFRSPGGSFDPNTTATEAVFAEASATEATAMVVSNAFYGMGVEAVLGGVKAFINVDSHFLMSDVIESLPSARVVLEILETVEESDAVMSRIRQLRSLGYSFALDDYIGDLHRYPRMMAEMQVLKVDIIGQTRESLSHLIEQVRRPRLVLLAEKVESREDFEMVRDLGFHLFQGYFFAKPQMLKTKQAASPQQADLLRLLRMTMNDSDPREIAEVMKRLPNVTLGVLRATNSGANGLRKKVSSLKEALILIGQERLSRIVQMMAYARPGSKHVNNPLMQMAAARGRLIEDLVRFHPAANFAEQDCAYLAGMLSLIEPIISGSLADVCQELGLGPELELALLHRQGVLGRLIMLCESVEQGQDADVLHYLSELQGVSGIDFIRLQIDAQAWARMASE
jgi:EAL and modified HD-GYP domain-containing signal transduction protein